MSISPARIAAYKALLRIERDKAFFSSAADSEERDLSELDRRLAHELILGTLRNQILLDDSIDAFLKNKKLDIEIRIILRMMLYQRFFVDRVPDHAAVKDAVDLAVFAKKFSAKGLVNAAGRSARMRDINSVEDDMEQVALATSHPRWILERWAGHYGRERAFEIAAANNSRGKLSFRSTAKGERSGFDPSTIGCEREDVVGCFVADKMTDDMRQALHDRLIAFQDPASQMVARSIDLGADSVVLDACAAPGGKSELIALSSRLVIAGDLHMHRVAAMRSRFDENGAENIVVLAHDALNGPPFPKAAFSLVLLDAPCSGTGTIRNNPDIRYRVSLSDIQQLSEKQSELINSVSECVAVSGQMLFSTCSLEPEEGEMVVDHFLHENPNFALIPFPQDNRFRTDAGYVRTIPGRDDMEGFFMAKLKRKG